MPMCKPGGKRCGAGRKPALYKTVVISFRVKEEWAEEIKEIVKTKIKQKNTHELRDKRNSDLLLMNRKETNKGRFVVYKSNIDEDYYFTSEENWHKYKPDGIFIALIESIKMLKILIDSKVLNKKNTHELRNQRK